MSKFNLALRKKYLGNDHPDVGDAAGWLAGLLWGEARLAEAEALYREALAIERKQSPGESADAVALTVYLAGVLYQQGKLAVAENMLRDEVGRVRKPSTNTASAETPQLALVLHHLAQVLRARKGLTEARSLAEEALRMYQHHPDWPEKDRNSAFAVYGSVLTDQAETLVKQGKPEEAADCLQETLDLVSTWPDDTSKANFLNSLSWNLATSGAPSLGNTGIAIEMAQKAVDITGRKSAIVLDTLAAAYAADGQFTNAVSVQKEAIALLTTDKQKEDYALRLKLYLDGIPYRDAGSLATRSLALLKIGNFAEAEPMARECLALYERLIPDNALTFYACSLLGGSLLGQKQYTEAEPLLVSGYEGMKQRENQIPAQYRPLRLKEALRRLVQLYEATGQSKKAAKYRQKLTQTDKSEASKQAGTP